MAVPFKPNTVGAVWNAKTARDIDDTLNDIYQHLRALQGAATHGEDGAEGRFVRGDDGERGDPGPMGPVGPTGGRGADGVMGPPGLDGDDGGIWWGIPPNIG